MAKLFEYRITRLLFPFVVIGGLMAIKIYLLAIGL
jgi:hypothetical protein